MRQSRLIISPSGVVRFIHDDDMTALLEGEGRLVTKRASHVEPNDDGGWTADMSPVGGPILLCNGEPFARKQDALDAEVAWLHANNIPIP